MQVITTRVHGIIDYVVGALLILTPFALGFADGTAAQWVMIVLGVGTFVVSLATQYELSVLKLIPMPVHLMGDLAIGVVLLASPWVFGFADRVWVPYTLFGVLPFIVVSLSQRNAPTQALRR
jgi:hypothetical protein